MTEQEHPIELMRSPAALLERQQLGEATSQIQYISQGHCLVIGEPNAALHASNRLHQQGVTIICIDPDSTRVNKRLTDTGIAVFSAAVLELSGHLGAFRAIASAGEGDDYVELDLGKSVYRETGYFDLVLDLSDTPVMPMRLVPFGYAHVTELADIAGAIEEFTTLTGEFEKPRYFNYNPSICAHGRSELKGCQRCLDVCTTRAIRSDGELVSVDPFLCQGCGSCATVCPTGAMTYAYPRPADAIARTRASLKASGATTVLLHTEALQSLVDAASLGHDVLALLVEEVSAFGADFWLAILAGQANRVIVVNDAPDDDPNKMALVEQIELVHSLFAGLGVDSDALQLVGSQDLRAESFNGQPGAGSKTLAGLVSHEFATHNDKRQTIRLALDVLSEQLAPVQAFARLPSSAPFGRIKVDTEACTLCMACVSTCPSKALLDGQDTPALRMIEANCVQCGLCEAACPESAISLESRYTWDSITARRIETLHEETPFHCITCHTPFTTRSMIETMTSKLTGHWMFKDEKAVRRLRMCGDCRVRDMFNDESMGISVHKEPT